MLAVPSYIANHELVLAAFGYWPRFHDADVVDFRRVDDEVDLTLHAFEMTREVDERGYFRLIKHHLVRLRFTDIADAELDRFWEMNGNSLDQLALSEERGSDDRFTVELESVVGGEFCGSFRARRAEVVNVVPCASDGHVEPSPT